MQHTRNNADMVVEEVNKERQRLKAMIMGLFVVLGIMAMLVVVVGHDARPASTQQTPIGAAAPAPSTVASDLELTFDDALSPASAQMTELWGFKFKAPSYKAFKDTAAKVTHSTEGAIKTQAINTGHNIVKDGQKVKNLIAAGAATLCKDAVTMACNLVGKEFKAGIGMTCAEMCSTASTEVLVLGAGNPLAIGVSTSVGTYCTKKCKDALNLLLTTGHLDVGAVVSSVENDAVSVAKSVPTSVDEAASEASAYAKAKLNSYLSTATNGMFTYIPTSLEQAQQQATDIIKAKGLAEWTKETGLANIPMSADDLQNLVKQLAVKEAEAKAAAISGGVIPSLTSLTGNTQNIFNAWGGDDLSAKICGMIGLH